MSAACSIRVRGVVQGVGFRPFVSRIARNHSLAGWVVNDGDGVAIHLEGDPERLREFLLRLEHEAPPLATISNIEVQQVGLAGFSEFTIRPSQGGASPTARISPDLPVCDDCLRELFDPHDRRYLYPYINCTNCGPRYTVIQKLPYDRENTTLRSWPLDAQCEAEYQDQENRRYHAQPVACPACGPRFFLSEAGKTSYLDEAAFPRAAALLADGKIVALKGLGGYHLACDARNRHAVNALRMRKYRKEKPFALMVPDVERARDVIVLDGVAESLLTSPARPIVLGSSRVYLPGVAPQNDELGVMLPYAPLHYLLFALGAPQILVMTSANRSSEPLAYKDDEAMKTLAGIADAFLLGERPIARRVDDSVVRVGLSGPVIIRRSRGYAPSAVTKIPFRRPVLGLGGDLKNTIALSIGGQVFVSQHIGDLEHYACFQTFRETVEDLTSMYEVRREELLIVHDAHPQYLSSQHALECEAFETLTVQHHRAHVASVLAERQAWDERVLGVSFDGTGYGDDGSIWGGEFFAGSVSGGLERVANLRPAQLVGADASARYPVQAAAGFLAQLEKLPAFDGPPFHFSSRFRKSSELLQSGLRTFQTTSVGRLFDCVAALLGFIEEVSFEGQAAMWVEHLARKSAVQRIYAFPFDNCILDFRPLLLGVIADRVAGRDVTDVARAFQSSVARGLCTAVRQLTEEHGTSVVVMSGGVFQNALLLHDVQSLLKEYSLEVWTNHLVPPNDGGLSLGQAVLGGFQQLSTSGPWTHTVENQPELPCTSSRSH